MKARWTTRCACGCGNIYAGGSFVRFRGGSWKPSCADRYRKQRESRKVAAGSKAVT